MNYFHLKKIKDALECSRFIRTYFIRTYNDSLSIPDPLLDDKPLTVRIYKLLLGRYILSKLIPNNVPIVNTSSGCDINRVAQQVDLSSREARIAIDFEVTDFLLIRVVTG